MTTHDPDNKASRGITETPTSTIRGVTGTLLVLFAFVIALLYWEGVNESIPFGDKVALTGVIISFLAFAGFLAALFMQRKELSLQRTELQLTREVLKGQEYELGRQAVQQIVSVLLEQLHRFFAEPVRTGKAMIFAQYIENLQLVDSKGTGCWFKDKGDISTLLKHTPFLALCSTVESAVRLTRNLSADDADQLLEVVANILPFKLIDVMLAMGSDTWGREEMKPLTVKLVERILPTRKPRQDRYAEHIAEAEANIRRKHSAPLSQ